MKRQLLALMMALPMLACAQSPYTAQGYQNDLSVQHFNAAERASQSELFGYEQAMANGLFAMYPTYWRLNNNLSSQDANTVLNFVRRYDGSVMAEKLVADFAETKAEQGDYASVQVVTPYIKNADASERCAIGHGVLGTPAISAYKDVWLNTTRQPPLCQSLAQQMAASPYISQSDLHERMVRLLRIDGRRLSKNRPSDDTLGEVVRLAERLNVPLSYQQLAQVRANPSAFAQSFNDPSLAGQYLYLYAISQLAHGSYERAVAQLSADIARGAPIGAMAKRLAYRSIAVKRMNMNTDDGFSPVALTWFQHSLGEPFNFEEAEDYAQVAIYFSRWQDVIQAVSLMDTTIQALPMWQYWLARAFENTGNRPQADIIYRHLAGDIDYYGLLAKDRLGIALTAQDIGMDTAIPDTIQVMQDPHFARAILLMQNNAKSSYIDREWNWAVRQARLNGNHRLIAAAAKVAADYGNYPRSIYAIQNSPVRQAKLSHPVLFSEAVLPSARRVGIDPAWAYGIIRQESRFQSAAQSSASASGLMQIIPGTAKQIARNLGEPVGDMNHPATNIRYGTWFLADLANKFGGQLTPATAGYNAGPNAAQAWLPSHKISGDQYAEAIPYGETRAYVKHVMENATIYGVVLGNPVPISQRMGVVGR